MNSSWNLPHLTEAIDRIVVYLLGWLPSSAYRMVFPMNDSAR